MPQELSASGLAEQARAEFDAVSTTVGAGDEAVSRQVASARQMLHGVIGATTSTLATRERLVADDVMNPAGRDRQMAALAPALMAATSDKLADAEFGLDVIAGVHLAALLHHDERRDPTLLAEIQNWTSNLTAAAAAGTLAQLAGNVRYSTMFAGPMGESLRARFGIKDPEFFRKIALQALAANGSPDQQRRSAALEGVNAMRRALGLARGARDEAAAEVQRPAAPKTARI